MEMTLRCRKSLQAGGILKLQDCNSRKLEDYITSVIKMLQCKTSQCVCGEHHWSSMQTHVESVVAFKACERKTCATKKADFVVNSEGNS